MASTTAITNSYKQEILQGIHTASDVYKIALYTSAATNDKTSTVYSSANEIVGTGYTAGGLTLTGYTVSASGDTAYIDWATDPSWASATITAASCLIYNSTRANKAVSVHDFGGNISSTNGTFTVQLPAPGATAIVRIA